MTQESHLFDRQELDDYANIIFWALQTSRAAKFRHGDIVLISFDNLALPLCEALYSRLMDEHLRPVPVMLPTPIMEVERYLNSSFAQLTFQIPGHEELYSRIAGHVNLLAPESLSHLQAVDPLIMAEARNADAQARKILSARKRAGTLGWTTCLYPSQALADAAGKSLEDYAHELKRSCWLNMPSPLKEWKRIKRELQEIADALNAMDIKSVRVESENIDLRVQLGDNRRFICVNGANIPSCEIYVSPDCRKVDGVYFANQPSVRNGNLVHGATLEFSDGIAARVGALKGEQFMQRELYSDAGARRVGEFSLTDKRFSRVDGFMAHTLLDENIGGEYGNCHIALGSSLPETFSGPQEMLTSDMQESLGFNASNIHWDLVNTEPKRVIATLANGSPRLIYENGLFKI